MTTFAALLRGINVGTAKRLAMADLRAIVTAAGFGPARTLLNSGNVVFTGTRQAPHRVAARLEQDIEAHAGFHPHVVVLDSAELATVIRENSLATAGNPSRLMVAFVQDRDRLQQVRDLPHKDWGEEAIVVGSRAAYVWAPHSVLDSPAYEALTRRLGTWVTARNWATVQKLGALATAAGDSGRRQDRA